MRGGLRTVTHGASPKLGLDRNCGEFGAGFYPPFLTLLSVTSLYILYTSNTDARVDYSSSSTGFSRTIGSTPTAVPVILKTSLSIFPSSFRDELKWLTTVPRDVPSLS